MTDQTQTNQQAIVDWAGDIVALVSHIEEALDHQLKLVANGVNSSLVIQELHDAIRDDKTRALAFQERVGSTAGNPVIKVGSEILGKAAGIIDRLRNDSVAKALRDDYTALNHLMVAYTMFHTTAMALKHPAARQFAEQGMLTTATLIQKVLEVIPEAVVQDLYDNKDVDSVDASVVAECRAEIDRIWSQASDGGSSTY